LLNSSRATISYQGVHALVMVGRVVDSVHADGVDAEALELFNVTLAASDIGDGILRISGTTWLVVDTTDVETLVASEESYGLLARTPLASLESHERTISLNSDWSDGGALLNCGRRSSNSGREDGSNGSGLHGDVTKS
jgi:hypothetical protein